MASAASRSFVLLFAVAAFSPAAFCIGIWDGIGAISQQVRNTYQACNPSQA
jgi:hypothetical protein